jgi:hypothetical protein
MSQPGVKVMAWNIGAENVDRGREYLAELDPEFHRYVVDFAWKGKTRPSMLRLVTASVRHRQPAGEPGLVAA